MNEKEISRRHFLLSGLAVGVPVALIDPRLALSETAAESTAPGKALGGPMDEGRPSKTAMRAAMHRAAHQLLDVPRILDDPLALPILGAKAESALRENLERFQRGRFLRAFIALRSRYAEDELVCAVQRGVRQYVVLGAGLDTFGYRNPYPGSRLRVIEVDHPATQAWKRARLHDAGIAVPESLTFAPVDFERQTLADGLRRAGFKAEEPAFFSLLGVVVYLTKTAAMETFRSVASLPPGSEIVFDYGILPSMLSERQRSARDARACRAAAVGEPWITYFDPAQLARELQEIGFRQVDDFGPTEARDRYFKDRPDGSRIGGGGRLMKARL